MSLTLAIPTWKNPQQLLEALVSLVRNTDFDGRLVVVNNGADDRLQHELNRAIPYRVDVINPGKNLGWAGGINAALAETDTDLFCMCNDDVLFLPKRDFWSTVYYWMNKVRAINIAGRISDVGGLGPISNYVSGYQNMHQHGMPDAYVAPLLIGFCAVYRTDLLKELGGLDESLPGGDDYDLSIRVNDAGYNLMVDRRLFVYHHGSQTGRRVHEGYWDSPEHQAATYNAIIHKHGLGKWYGMLNGLIAEQEGNWATHSLTIDSAYREAKVTPSDMYEHMEALRTLGSMVKHVTEFGTDDGTSTLAWLAARPEKVVCYDIRRKPEIDDLAKIVPDGTAFEFHQTSTLDVEIEPTDLLFIDDLHTYAQVKAELGKHAGKVRRYIVFHDAESCRVRGDDGGPGILPAITEFMRDHPEWRLVHYVTHNNGLLALSRVA